MLKPKCTSSINVFLRSKDWQKIFRGTQFPHVSCSTQATREVLAAVTGLHLVKKGTKSMPTSVVLTEKHKGLCLLILLLLKIWRYEPSSNVVRQDENKNKNFFWLLEVFILLGLELLERCCLGINVNTLGCSVSASYFTAQVVDGSPFWGKIYLQLALYWLLICFPFLKISQL